MELEKKMELQKKIEDFMQKFCNKNDYIGPISEGDIQGIEASLGVMLPEDYKWFLRTYGCGGCGWIEIEGGALNGATPGVVVETERCREVGLPQHLILILNCDEYICCLDTSKMKDGFCPVVGCEFDGDYPLPKGDSFLEFFYQELLDYDENWSPDT